jgi:deoxyadenosine/deoxycytidine kinase
MEARKIGVVGTCGTGKSELVNRLNFQNFDAHHIAQEHSYISNMWQLVTNPDILIYLRVSYHETLRRKDFSFSFDEYKEQLDRLKHAETHASMVIDTDKKTPDEVYKIVLSNLE